MRIFWSLVVGLVVLMQASCASKPVSTVGDAGKIEELIVAKWGLVEPQENVTFKGSDLRIDPGVIVEFRSDGILRIYSTAPGTFEKLGSTWKHVGKDEIHLVSGAISSGGGGPTPSKVKGKVSGDELVLTDENGSYRFKRLGPSAAPATNPVVPATSPATNP